MKRDVTGVEEDDFVNTPEEKIVSSLSVVDALHLVATAIISLSCKDISIM